MGRSFGKAAYRALSRRSAALGRAPINPRAPGELIWLHAPEKDNMLAIQYLAQRISSAREDAQILVTVPDEVALNTLRASWTPPETVLLDTVPTEHPDAVAGFLDHYKPGVALWAWGALRPNLIWQAQNNGVLMALIDGAEDGFDGHRDRWLPDFSRNLLAGFDTILVRSRKALLRLQTLGIPTARVDVTPPLQAGGQALYCDDADLTEMSLIIAGRPVWLAAHVQESELSTVLNAHRKAQRLSHRLLLILNPAKVELTEKFRDAIAAEQLRMTDWSAREEPDDSTQVMLANDTGDLGLFYRIAPVSFVGSSLTNGFGGHDPFDAAALGSAVLYGPNVRRYLAFYSRLAEVGAARIVNDGESLGTAVTQLIAPDQAATMAVAGWDVISQGAALTDRVIELVQNALDNVSGGQDARA